jgi:hypothetical protein
MPRPLRPPIENGLYHVTSRGNRRSEIYRDGADRKYFLGLLSNVVERFGWLVHAYCLIRAGIEDHPAAYTWSSYRATVGSVERPAFLACDAILEEFGPRLDDAQAAYASFVKAGIEEALRVRWSRGPGLTPDVRTAARAA